MSADDEIRALCLRASQTKDQAELAVLLAELLSALSQRILEVQNLGIHMILNAPKVSIKSED